MLMLCGTIMAQEDNLYENPANKYEDNRNKLSPRYANFQYAGSMGLVSAGLGWNYGKRDRWETDLMVGYIPKYTTNKAKVCITLKENFVPWNLQLKNRDFYIQPLTSSFYVNTVLSDEFWMNEPEKYPSSYYTFSTKLRFNISIGQRIFYNVPAHIKLGIKSIAAFYEISTCDLYIISAIGNSNLKYTNYLHLSLGIKLGLQ